jgi:hypothetical protein
MAARAIAPAQPTEAECELRILRAKAEVCDAYRLWLVTTRRAERSAVSRALIKLQRLEQALLRGAS